MHYDKEIDFFFFFLISTSGKHTEAGKHRKNNFMVFRLLLTKEMQAKLRCIFNNTCTINISFKLVNNMNVKLI